MLRALALISVVLVSGLAKVMFSGAHLHTPYFSGRGTVVQWMLVRNKLD